VSPTLVVVNPRSRAGATGRRFAAVEPRLRRALGPLEVAWTQGPRDAERLAREAVRDGVSRIVVAGGDGTAGEVVSGLLDGAATSSCQLGLLPLGTGGDLVRTLRVPRDVDAAVAALARGHTRRLDAGRASFRTAEGGERTVSFLNEASVGLSGLTTRLVNEAPKAFGGRISFLVGALRAIARFDFPSIRVVADGEPLHEGPISLATASNGRFFGGGMQVAPGAEPDDGLFDAVVVPGFPRARLVWELPRIYRGSHLGVAGVSVRRARRLEVQPLAGGPVWIELDGEPLGVAPARFDLLPGAVNLFGAVS
jgi:diacylglycerol kinase (ATP)